MRPDLLGDGPFEVRTGEALVTEETLPGVHEVMAGLQEGAHDLTFAAPGAGQATWAFPGGLRRGKPDRRLKLSMQSYTVACNGSSSSLFLPQLPAWCTQDRRSSGATGSGTARSSPSGPTWTSERGWRVSPQAISGRTAVVGIGVTEFSKASGTTPLNLAARASLRAIDDAGLSVSDIDGVVTYQYGRYPQGQTYPADLARTIGLDNTGYELFSNLGGHQCCGAVATAAMAVHSGIAKNVLLYYGINGRTKWPTGSHRAAWPIEVTGTRQPEMAFGLFHPAATFGLPVVAHMAKYGTTNLDMAHLAVTQRGNALLNTKAMMKRPLTVDEHQASPWVIYPYRQFDCCLQSDGAGAIVISSAERARDLRRSPVHIHGYGGAIDDKRTPWQTGGDKAAARLYAAAGLTPGDVDFAELYDPFTGVCMLQMENFGFAPEGGSGEWVRASGNSLDGDTPVNTHGGLLSEGYLHGLNSVIEAVQQLRRGGVVDDLCDGPHDYDRSRCRQVRDAEVGLVCGESGGSALLLTAG